MYVMYACINRVRRTVTLLIETNVLPVSYTANFAVIIRSRNAPRLFSRESFSPQSISYVYEMLK